MLKKVITAVLIATCAVISVPNTSEAAVAVGLAPTGTAGAQARVMARRAAQVVAIKQCGGKMPQVISESWDGNQYIINY